MTRIVSLKERISLRSADTSKMAFFLARMSTIFFRMNSMGTHVNAPGGLVHDKKIWIIVKFPSHDQLLDVSAGKLGHGLLRVIVFYQELL